MQDGLLWQRRTEILSQAAMVWKIGELADDGIAAFLHYGEILTKKVGPPPNVPGLEQKMAEIAANGGRLIVR